MRTLRAGPLQGEGVVVRHARSCGERVRGNAECACGPHFQAWVYLPDRAKKVRRTFATLSEARRWRQDYLRRLYGEKPAAQRRGRLDEGYSLLRRSASEFDRALAQAQPPLRAHVREALEALHVAEDAALRALLSK